MSRPARNGPSRNLDVRLPQSTIAEMRELALANDCNLSWIIRAAWARARLRVASFPPRKRKRRSKRETETERVRTPWWTPSESHD